MVRTISDEHVAFIGRIHKAAENHNLLAKKAEVSNELPDGYLGRVTGSDLYGVWIRDGGDDAFPMGEYGKGGALWSFDMKVPRAALIAGTNSADNFRPLYRNHAKGAHPEVVFQLQEEIRRLRAELARATV